jgi:uncharacterized membrane protein YbhN (UPF0104 family)
MAYPESPVQRTRPGTVNAAVYALYALTALQVIGLILAATAIGPMVDAARDYVPDTSEGDATVTFIQIFQYVGIAISLLFAIAYLVLAIFTGRGKNAARIVTWVVLGISLCCGVGGAASTALGNSMGGNSTANGIDQEELARRISDALPGWYNALNYTLLTLGIILALAAIILLALPASNAFFRKQEAVWEPPVPGATYPQPGQPPAGQDPGYPPPSGS